MDDEASRAREQKPEVSRKGDEATAGGDLDDDTQQTRDNEGDERND
jgi:hypothetical protein